MLHIRRYKEGDAAALLDVFNSAVRIAAAADYSPEQLDAWAPRQVDAAHWEERLRSNNPFVVELDGHAVAFADLQPNGYIDQFFVSGSHSRKGLGSALMGHLLRIAAESGIEMLTSHVSLTAQPLYKRFGFEIVEQRMPVVRGVSLSNAPMCRRVA